MIYHYTKFVYFRDILNGKSLWLTNISKAADKSERYSAYDKILELIENSDDEDLLLLKNNLTLADKESAKVPELQLYAASFCRRYDNIYLWENYAREQGDVAIGFDEEYFFNSLDSIIKEYFNGLEGNFCSGLNQQIFRKIYYDCGQSGSEYLKIIKMLKPENFILDNNPSAYKDWLDLSVSALTGIMKSEKYSIEEEVRILFPNYFSEDYLSKHQYYEIVRTENSTALEKLGLCSLELAPKEHFNLNLSDFFGSELIREICVKKNCSKERIDSIKEIIVNNGLNNTSLKFV